MRVGDGVFLADLGDTAQPAHRRYSAAFAREPEEASGLDAHGALLSAARSFLTVVEFTSLGGGNVSDNDYATALYRNALGRAPTRRASPGRSRR